jgi:glutamate-1-semialdehyde 2,1-aminomutase
MAAGLAMLRYIAQNPSIYDQLEKVSGALSVGMEAEIKQVGLNFTINRVGSMLTLFFTDAQVVDFSTAKSADASLFAKYFQHMLGQGVYLPPSQFEAMFISTSIDQDIVERILASHRKALRAL